ncbi:MAG TPA: hypothetical protein VLM78_03845 [Anaerolineales bacterium]|nr:hypothetical protein [Anaerolineales bacterium]
MKTQTFFLLVVLALFLLTACGSITPIMETATPTPEPSPTATPTVPPPTTGMLVVEIVYSGQWYRETFDYQPDAPNIRHVVLAMPVDSIIQLAGAGWAFSNLKFTPSPEPLAMREVAVEFIPILDFMYDAPGGVVSIELDPGEYNVAAAFIAAALPPPGGDAILYPGVTGGGASNEFQVVEITAGKTVYLSVELTDKNGWGYLMELAAR